MGIRRNRFLLLSALLVSALAAIHLSLVQRTQAKQERPHGRYTSRQIIARTDPLCQLLAPQAGRLRLSADRTFDALWLVHCEDEAGNFIAHFIWDADAGDLRLVGHVPPWQVEGLPSPLSQREAVQTAWRWMRALGIAEKASRWKVIHAPEKVGLSWHIRWQAEGRTAGIKIDLRSGDLRAAYSWRRNVAR